MNPVVEFQIIALFYYNEKSWSRCLSKIITDFILVILAIIKQFEISLPDEIQNRKKARGKAWQSRNN